MNTTVLTRRMLGPVHAILAVVSNALIPLLTQPDGLRWPTDDWPQHEPPESARSSTNTLIAEHADSTEPTDPLGAGLGLVVIHRGAIVAEQYGPGTDAGTDLISWSMAKSVLHAAVGIALGDGLVDIDTSIPVSAWSTGEDARGAITWRQLLEMRSGLSWNEDYVDDKVSNVIDMLFGAGAADTAGYAADRPLEHAPGSYWCYSSGTSNIICAALTELLGGADALKSLLTTRLFEPLGMNDPQLTFDEAGTWVASSYLHTTARNFARFGLLYARDGVWDQQRLLPQGWVDSARIAHAYDPTNGYGYASHWWTSPDGHGTFSCNGYEGQRIQIVPAADLIIVRLGKTPADRYANLRDFYVRLTGCFI
jgi:CubicO group peptidase (beta-lactamase class C family)